MTCAAQMTRWRDRAQKLLNDADTAPEKFTKSIAAADTIFERHVRPRAVVPRLFLCHMRPWWRS